ncbi:MAG: 50S ribosomal protein L25 [Leptospirales bacterium]|jgi:large subunit ribosomal protein L25
MSELKLNSELRKETGKGVVGRMRRDGKIPGNVIADGKSTVITIDNAEFQKVMQAGLRTSSVIQLDIAGSDASGKVIVKELQREPVSGRVLHVDFYRITPGRKTLMTVPVEVTGQSKGVKAGGALEQYISRLKVRATPETFKEIIHVDVTNLGVSEGVTLSQLDIPSEWEILLQGDPIIVRIARSRMTKADDDDTEDKPAAAEAS